MGKLGLVRMGLFCVRVLTVKIHKDVGACNLEPAAGNMGSIGVR